MAVEIANAYVSIIPTTKGIQASLEQELSPLSGVASKVGADSGKALGSSFTSTSGGLKSSLGEAEGHFGNLKTKATGALDSIGVSSGMLKAAGGAALVGFAVSTVGAFTDTAKAALDLSTATGLSTEEASRWLGIADDYEVSATALQTGLGKIAKTLDDSKWSKYGIETRDAGGKARSTNDILLDSFDTLSKVTNETEKAAIGQELFGKGYQSLTPILGHTRAEYEKMLGAVEKGQVITASEAASAEKMRLAQDQLSDALKDIQIQAGAALAKLSPLLVGLAKFIALAAEAFGPGGLVGTKPGGFSDIQFALEDLDYQIKESGHSFDWWRSEIMKNNYTVDTAVAALHEFDKVTGDSTTSTEGYSYALEDVERSQRETEAAVRSSTNSVEGYSYAVDDVAKHDAAAAGILKANAENTERAVKASIDNMIRKWSELTTPVTEDQAWINLRGTFNDLQTAAVDAFTAAADKTADAEQKGLDYETKINDVRLGAIEYGKTILGLPPEKLTTVLLEIDQGRFDIAENMLKILTRNRTMTLSITAKGGPGYSPDNAFATGGYTPGGTVLVGEKGPELVKLPIGSYVHTASDTRSMMSPTSMSPNSTWTPRLNIEHLEVHNDTDADGFFRYANFALAAAS